MNMITAELVDLATTIGNDPLLVQGAGGNISQKTSAGIMAVKASGTRLKDAKKTNIFVTLNLALACEEVLTTEKLSYSIIESAQNDSLRPSIETAIHALLPHKFVLHVHSVAAVAASSVDVEVSLTPLYVWAEKNQTKIVNVAYVKPGIALAKAILAARKYAKDDISNLVVILGNHGLITASQDSDTALKLIYEVEKILRQTWADEQTSTKLSSISVKNFPNWKKVKNVTLAKNSINNLLKGPLTPDSAVFLGRKPFTDNPLDKTAAALISKNQFYFRPGLSEDAQEIALSFVEVAKYFPQRQKVLTLSDDNIAQLINWEAEKWRQKMAN